MGIENLGPFYDAEGNDITESVLAEANEGNNVSGLRKKFEAGIAETKVEKEARDAAEKRAAAAERQLVLRDSGIDFSNPMSQYFADTYNGEMTVEAVKASAAKIGLIAQSEDPVLKAEMQAMERIARASSSTPAAPTELDPIEAVAKYSGSSADFDAWFIENYGSRLDDTNGGALWDKPKNSPVTSPSPRRGFE